MWLDKWTIILCLVIVILCVIIFLGLFIVKRRKLEYKINCFKYDMKLTINFVYKRWESEPGFRLSKSERERYEDKFDLLKKQINSSKIIKWSLNHKIRRCMLLKNFLFRNFFEDSK